MIAQWTLTRYLARHFFLWFMIFLASLTGIIFLFEVAELFRRAADAANVTLGVIVTMGLYKLPMTVDRILPFVVLFSGLYTFWKLTKSQELIVARASGVSVWQFITPALAVTFLFSLFNLALLNPLGASFSEKYKALETKYLQRSDSLELTGAGLWLRQVEAEEQRHYLLHADRVEMAPLRLIPLIAFVYDKDDRYLSRIDAPQAVLVDNHWQIENAWTNGAGEAPVHHDLIQIKTGLTMEKIQESMAPPATISIWRLPSFIDTLRAIGFPPILHELRFQSLLATPLFLCSMVFFSAVFSLRLSRSGGILKMTILGLFTSSALFSLDNVVNAMGANQTFPVFLAAWSIPLISFIAGFTSLLYLEDG